MKTKEKKIESLVIVLIPFDILLSKGTSNDVNCMDIEMKS